MPVIYHNHHPCVRQITADMVYSRRTQVALSYLKQEHARMLVHIWIILSECVNHVIQLARTALAQ